MDTIKLTIPAGQATATPPIGPLLGQKGINAIDFCKQFNELTKSYHPTFMFNVKIFVENKKFTFELGYPSTMSLLKKAALLKKSNGSYVSAPATLNIRWIYILAEMKASDPRFPNSDVKSICKSILGTARSMHLEIIK